MRRWVVSSNVLLKVLRNLIGQSVRPYCKSARRDRCQEYHNCFPFGELEETTRTSSNYMNEDYPARPEIKQSLPGWGDNCDSESSTLETDVCVWRYAPLVVFATQQQAEEESNRSRLLPQPGPWRSDWNEFSYIAGSRFRKCLGSGS